MLSDEWFAERFIKIEGRLGTIDNKVSSIEYGISKMDSGHDTFKKSTNIRLTKLERISRGEDPEFTWKDRTKQLGKWTGILTIIGAIFTDLYLRLKGGG